MSHIVGSKGQVVIKKEIREQLGVKPGWRAVQHLVGDHVEIYFVPAEHNRSLAGSLAKYAKRTAPTEDALRQAREAAWRQTARDRFERDRGE